MSTNRRALSDRVRALTDDVDWKQAGIYGGAAWLVGYLISYVIVTIADVTPPNADTTEVAMLAYFEATGGLYDMSVDGTALLYLYEHPTAKFWAVGVLLHYLLAPIALVVAGYLLAGTYAEDGDLTSFEGRLQAWAGGVSLVAAFGGLTFVGIYGVGPSGGDPEGLRLLLACVVYPAAFAGLGAARRVGFRLRPLRSTGLGLGAFVVGLLLWNYVEDPFGGAVDLGDLSGAGEFLPYLGVFLADHGAFVTPGQSPDGSTSPLLGSRPDMGIVGSVDPAWILLLGPAIVAGAIVYRDDVADPIVGLGAGARLSLGYVLGVALLTLAVFGQRMSWLYDEIYGTGPEQQVRQQLYHYANDMFGALLPQVVLVAGVLWPVVFGAAGGAIGAKVVESQLEEDTVQPANSGGAPQQAE